MFGTGFYLFTRVIAVTFCVTLAASLAARLGATPMAAFQICLQVWLASSLLADGLAVAFWVQMSFVLGLGLAIVVGMGLQFGGGIFTPNVNVLHLISIAIPVRYVFILILGHSRTQLSKLKHN